MQRGLFDRVLGFWSEPASGRDVLARTLSSPYETNPLNINPLRDVIADLIDFERVRACERGPALHHGDQCLDRQDRGVPAARS